MGQVMRFWYLHVVPHRTHDNFSRNWVLDLSFFLINPQSAKKKMHLKMSSAEVVCCKYLPYITYELSINANSVDPEQTAPIKAV